MPRSVLAAPAPAGAVQGTHPSFTHGHCTAIQQNHKALTEAHKQLYGSMWFQSMSQHKGGLAPVLTTYLQLAHALADAVTRSHTKWHVCARR